MYSTCKVIATEDIYNLRGSKLIAKKGETGTIVWEEEVEKIGTNTFIMIKWENKFNKHYTPATKIEKVTK